MKQSNLVAFILLALLMLFSMALADSDQGKAEDSNRVTPEPNLAIIPQNSCELLSYTRDLWHDATLKGDDKKITQHLAEIENILDRDIKAGKQMIKMLAQQAMVKQTGETQSGNNLLDERALKNVPKVDRELILEFNSIVSTKEILAESIRRTSAFSNKYRLLGDYIQLLRRELDMPRLQFALEKCEVK